MKSRRFGFLRHYRKIKIEGFDLSSIVNKCIRNRIVLKNVRWKGPLESVVDIQADDFSRLKKLAGHSYRMTVLKEGGAIPVFRRSRNNVITITGAFLLGALLFYQSLFIAEIQIDGYRSISEEKLRNTMREAGLYEGAKKPDEYGDIKAAIYRNHSEVTWVSIYEDGRQIRVSISEAGKEQEAEAADSTPVNIVAEKAGIIEEISPLQGNAKVREGDYVNKGDVLISGRLRYQSTDYSRGDGFFYMYSHAEGQVYARVPRQLEFYVEKTDRRKKPTGKSVRGICMKFGDISIDTATFFSRYEVSEKTEKKIIDIVRPMPLEISVVKISEVTLVENPVDREKLRKTAEAALRQYAKDNLDDGEEIADSSIEFFEMENVIRISAFTEVIEEIGKERKINVKKEEKSQEKSDESGGE